MSELADADTPTGEPLEDATAVPEADAESFGVEGLLSALQQARVAELLVSTVSTLASVAYGKLEGADLPESRLAIDAIGALVPLLSGQLEAGIVRDLEQALANLRLAYADAVAAAQ